MQGKLIVIDSEAKCRVNTATSVQNYFLAVDLRALVLRPFIRFINRMIKIEIETWDSKIRLVSQALGRQISPWTPNWPAIV